MADNARGATLLHDPRLNKGTAFPAEERQKLGLEGLLPPAVIPLELQVTRVHSEIDGLQDDLQKYLVLSDLQARNEALFLPFSCLFIRVSKATSTGGRLWALE